LTKRPWPNTTILYSAALLKKILKYTVVALLLTVDMCLFGRKVILMISIAQNATNDIA